jgi:hypothetical protein
MPPAVSVTGRSRCRQSPLKGALQPALCGGLLAGQTEGTTGRSRAVSQWSQIADSALAEAASLTFNGSLLSCAPRLTALGLREKWSRLVDEFVRGRGAFLM